MKLYLFRIWKYIYSPYFASLDKKYWNAGHTVFNNEGATSFKHVKGNWYKILFENSKQ